MLSTAWSHFITSHPLSTQISWTTDKHNITDILNPSQTPLSNDEEAIRLMHLSSYPSIIILTLDPFNHSILTSFQHDHLPDTTNPTPNTHTLVALTGFSSSATPIQINTSDFFSSTDTLYATPTLQDFLSMHDKSLDDLKLISALETHTHPIRRTAVLPPFLNQIAFTHPSGSSPWTFLHSIIKCIWDQGQSQLPRLIVIAEEDETEDPDHTNPVDNQVPPPTPIDWSFADQLLPILISLWGFANHSSIPNLTTRHTAASSSSASAWAQRKQDDWHKELGVITTHAKIHTPPRRRSHTDDELSTASSIDKLQETLDAHARRFARPDGDDTPMSPQPNPSSDSKAWKAIDETFRRAILFASSPDGQTSPTTPCERLIRIIQAKTGPTAASLIQRWHNPRLDLCIQPGMALHIIKGQLTSTPTPFSIDTFSPFFCPPTRVGFANISNRELNEFELVAKSLAFSANDIKKMTACKPYIPTTVYIFIAQVRNFDAILSDVLTPTSYIRAITTDLAIQHYELNQLMYHTIFDEHQHFGVWMLNRLHFKVQSILHQCYQVDNVTDIDFVKFSIQHELHQIDTLSFTADPPQWHKLELDKIKAKLAKDTKDMNTPWDELDLVRRSRRGRRGYDENGDGVGENKRNKVSNQNMHPNLQLHNGEVYSKLVHYKNLEICKNEAPKFKGDFVCNNFHLRGHCHDGCKRHKSHTTLPPDILTKYRNYITALRKCRDTFENRRRHGHGSHGQDTDYNDRQGENDRHRS
jgi:hypothetical protein